MLLHILNWILLFLGDVAQWLYHGVLGGAGQAFVQIGERLDPVLSPLVRWMNAVLNPIAGVAFSPLGWLPGWVSITLISAAAGVILLFVYKHTSNQAAIGRIRDGVQADLLALKLFKDEPWVVIRSQGRVLWGSLRLLRYSLVPLLVMFLPVTLLLGQMGAWYQQRPLRPGEAALVAVRLNRGAADAAVEVRLESGEAVAEVGPVHVDQGQRVYWRIRAGSAGKQTLRIHVGAEMFEKSLAVGDGFMPVRVKRPGASWTDRIVHPLERPFGGGDAVASIEVSYPARDGWASGTKAWIVYFFLASLAAGLAVKPAVGVRI